MSVTLERVVQACKTINLQIPLVVRLAGTNVEAGRKIIDESGLAIVSADTLADAAQKAVTACNSQKAKN